MRVMVVKKKQIYEKALEVIRIHILVDRLWPREISKEQIIGSKK